MEASDKYVFDRVIGWIKSGRLQLPVYSPTTIKMQQYMDDYSGDIAAVEELISSDQVLAVEVLRAANSPFYRTISSIDTIRNAIVRLGMQQLRRLVILVSERTRYSSRYPDLHKLMFLLWQHVSATALSAQWLSQRLRLTGIRDVCFLGGLLHDIGKLVILKAIDEMRKAEEFKTVLSDGALAEFIAANHCQIGYEVLKRWEIPDVYCQIGRDHHRPEIPVDDLPLAIVRLANNSSLLLFGDSADAARPFLVETPEATLLKVDEDLLVELQETLEEHRTVAA
ncbi:MAG: HDOD domain-containing protein [Acidobacteriota bacterium]|jgi:HD-like signal output (HDOD) protein|nr:HDOD domain-containing protein [Acidobacteriota bacterium]